MLCIYNNCKKKSFTNNCNFCKNHLLLNNNINILKIQKIYKGYKTRKKINNIFIKLPNDLQKIIINYLNIQHYYNRYYNTLNNIIIKKTNNLLNYKNNQNNKCNINYIIQSYNYFNKYNLVMNINTLKYIYVLTEELLNNVNEYIYNYFNNNFDVNLFFNNTELNNFFDLTTDSFDKILVLSNKLNNFLNIYNYYYNVIKSNNSIK